MIQDIMDGLTDSETQKVYEDVEELISDLHLEDNALGLSEDEAEFERELVREAEERSSYKQAPLPGNRISVYPTVWAIGHTMVADLFNGPVIIEEKVDGSQISFLRTHQDELIIRSKGADQTFSGGDSMFNAARLSIESRFELMQRGRTYRGEYLSKPHHNALTYSRVPNGNIIIFDIDDPSAIPGGGQRFLSPIEKLIEADRLGLEVVPMLWNGPVKPDDIVQKVMDFVRTTESVLGGPKIEGVVVKNYAQYTREKKYAIGKWVSEEFKEVHREAWGTGVPRVAFEQVLAAEYRTDARWLKAIQHLRENGVLENAPKDIGPLMKEINADVLKECRDEISEKLFEHFWKTISKGITLNFPQWYKDRLLESAGL